jgi:hypothetical protein
MFLPVINKFLYKNYNYDTIRLNTYTYICLGEW